VGTDITSSPGQNIDFHAITIKIIIDMVWMLRTGIKAFFSRLIKTKPRPQAPELSEKHSENNRMDPLDPSIDASFLA